MKMENKFNEWIGKKIFLVTKSNRKYSGVIKEVTERFIFLLSKFNEKIVININEISSLEEEE